MNQPCGRCGGVGSYSGQIRNREGDLVLTNIQCRRCDGSGGVPVDQADLLLATIGTMTQQQRQELSRLICGLPVCPSFADPDGGSIGAMLVGGD